MKILKRILYLIAFCLIIAICASAYMYWRSGRAPSFIKAHAWTLDQRSQRAMEAVNKMAPVINMAQVAPGSEAENVWLREHGNKPLTITFTDEEVNAFIQHFINDKNVSLDPYAQDTWVYLKNGYIIISGRVKELGGKWASIYFKPELADDGQLKLTLDKTEVGEQRLPGWAVNSQIEKLVSPTVKGLEDWKSKSTMDSSGQVNHDTVKAATAQLMLDAIKGRPSDPVLFALSPDGHKWWPVRLTHVEVGEDQMTVTVRRLTAEERSTFMEHVRAPYVDAD